MTNTGDDCEEIAVSSSLHAASWPFFYIRKEREREKEGERERERAYILIANSTNNKSHNS